MSLLFSRMSRAEDARIENVFLRVVRGSLMTAFAFALSAVGVVIVSQASDATPEPEDADAAALFAADERFGR
jgi:hypothetical protein